jgi:hypothetical protein
MTIQVSEFAPERHLKGLTELLNNEYRDSFEFVPFDEERIKYRIRRWDMSVLVAEEKGNAVGLIGTHLEEHGEVDISWLAAREDMTERELKICS